MLQYQRACGSKHQCQPIECQSGLTCLIDSASQTANAMALFLIVMTLSPLHLYTHQNLHSWQTYKVLVMLAGTASHHPISRLRTLFEKSSHPSRVAAMSRLHQQLTVLEYLRGLLS